MSEVTHRRIGSTVFQRHDGSYAFILHFVPEDVPQEEWTLELVLAHSADGQLRGEFETLDEAKAAGTKALDITIDRLKAKGISAFRPERA